MFCALHREAKEAKRHACMLFRRAISLLCLSLLLAQCTTMQTAGNNSFRFKASSAAASAAKKKKETTQILTPA